MIDVIEAVYLVFILAFAGACAQIFGLKRNDSRKILGGWVALSFLFLLLRLFDRSDNPVYFLVLSGIALNGVILMFGIRTLLQSNQLHTYKNQSLASLFQLFQFKYPLPPMFEWAVTPELGAVIADAILEHKPAQIVEIGSGISTVLASYAVDKNGSGQILSLDSDGDYFQVTRRNVAKHGFEHIANVIHAPLKDHKIDGKTWKWYDLQHVNLAPKSIQLLVVDGPFTLLQDMARFPAVPLLKNLLADNAIIILDDAARKSEQKTVEAWLKLLPGYHHTFIRSDRGISILSPKN